VMRAGFDAPDHTTLSRRSQRLDLASRAVPAHGPLHLIVDSTGLSRSAMAFTPAVEVAVPWRRALRAMS